MKVRELMLKLAMFDGDMEVVARGYEDGYDSVEYAEITNVIWNSNVEDGKKLSWWSGEHSESDRYGDERDGVDVVNIG